MARSLPPLVADLGRTLWQTAGMKMPAIESLARNVSMKRLVRDADERAVSQEWASWYNTSFEPYWFERHQYSRGRRLAKQPHATKDATLYARDERGQITRIRTWSGFLRKWHGEETFLPERDGVIVGYRFGGDGRLANVNRWTFDGERRLLFHEVWFAEAKRSGSQRFIYEDGLLARVDVKDWGHGWKLTHDGLGRLESIVTVYDEGEHEIYRRPAKGEKLDELLALIVDQLRELIPKAAARAKPRSPAYALLLVVDEEEWRYLLPPTLVMGFEEDRRRFRAQQPDRLREFLWSAAELEGRPIHALELRDARLLKACERANQHLWKGGKQARVTPLVRRLAKELQTLDWPALRKVSDDFVVYATSLEGDGWRDVRRDAPAAIKKRLIARKEL